ncbi:hypothetical protein F2Q69_00024721 [Brassica cretica]|uniref:Uncharacterized protein n=1 Tax=Brassica cretica TaxID=69181 RepID=A0A8S9Q0V3_BRACR|nr:hypothetical protein F2Q69_00024721 [Brassica cretica]
MGRENVQAGQKTQRQVFHDQLNQLVGQAQPAGPTVSQLNSAGWSVWRLSWLDELGGGYESMVGSGADPVLFD